MILVLIYTPTRTLHNSAHISDKCNPVIITAHAAWCQVIVLR
jgi:hypothetical protein